MRINKNRLLNIIAEVKKDLDQKAMNKIDKALIRFFIILLLKVISYNSIKPSF